MSQAPVKVAGGYDDNNDDRLLCKYDHANSGIFTARAEVA